MRFLRKYIPYLILYLAISLAPEIIGERYKVWIQENIPYYERWGLGIFILLVAIQIRLDLKSDSQTKEKTTSKNFEPEIRDWLLKRYQNRLDQKLAGRMPINLRRIDFSKTAAQISQKQFKEIAPNAIQAELTKFFHEAEGRLLIVGAPGAGKTTLLLDLAVKLLETEPDALPAVVNLATWSSEFKTLDEWLKKILPVELGVTTALAVRLLAESRVILLFDGLDEIPDAEQRAVCLAAIDLFVSPARPRREFAISSRTQEFREAGRVPLVSFPIEVGPLEMTQIERELTRRDPAQTEDRDLLAALKKDKFLREAAETPFYFNCLQLLFGENRRPVFSAPTRLGREREILDAFVENELEKCSKLETQKWLSFLANRMSERDLVRFELRDLQYDWWRWSRKMIFSIILEAIVGSCAGLLFMTIIGLAPIVALYKYTHNFYNLLLIPCFGLLFVMILIFLLTVFTDIRPSKIETNDVLRFSKVDVKPYLYMLIIMGGGISILSIFISPIRTNFILWQATTFLSVFAYIVFDFFVHTSEAFLQINTPYKRFYSSAINLHFSIFQHLLLRYKLSQKSLLPLRLVSFLNEMASYEPKLEKWKIKNEKRRKSDKPELPRPSRPDRFSKHPVHLMESDGASWRFRHRLIQEWFAEKWVEPKA